jgi:hypothetical protein
MAVRWCRSRRLVSIGGDGTALAAIHAGAGAARPVLAVACGSPGALTSVPSHRLVDALERFRGATRSHGACRRARGNAPPRGAAARVQRSRDRSRGAGRCGSALRSMHFFRPGACPDSHDSRARGPCGIRGRRSRRSAIVRSERARPAAGQSVGLIGHRTDVLWGHGSRRIVRARDLTRVSPQPKVIGPHPERQLYGTYRACPDRPRRRA